jgi:hypothetical protein
MSEKPVAERLQVKGGRTLAVVGAPGEQDVQIGALGKRAALDTADIVLLFASDQEALSRRLTEVQRERRPDAILWIAYPKLTSTLARDLSRDVLKTLVLGHGLDTVSQIAIDADWSALRFKSV